MSISQSLRDQIRALYNQCCGYCGTAEWQVGGELEIEHFRPRSKGGDDSVSNLVYSCTTCNRFKAAYWPSDDAPAHQHLLHPINDDTVTHIELTDQGRLVGVTARGWFHINWLQLNRPQLILARQYRARLLANANTETQYQRIITTLRAENSQLAQELAILRAHIARLQNET